MIRQIPESDEPSQKSLIESIFEGLGFEDSTKESIDHTENEDDSDPSMIASQVKSIVEEEEDDGDDGEEDGEDGESEVDDEDDDHVECTVTTALICPSLVGDK